MDARKLARLTVAALAILPAAAFVACSGEDDEPEPTTASTSAATSAATTAATSAASVAATATRAAASPAASGNRVSVGDNSFGPSTLNVAAGTTVTWNFAGAAAPHSVVGKFDGQDVKSAVATGSGTFEFTFSKAGTFDYQCGVHGPSMAGKVVVS